MKKIYMQPQTDVCEMQPIQMIANSPSVTGTGAAEIGWGGNDSNPGAGADVKGNEWGDIWD